MRKAVVGAAAAVTLIATQVMAADIAAKAPLPMPPAAPPPLNWTGCNLNGGFGYGLWNQTQHTELGGVQESVDITSGGRGWLGRLGGGCDFQIPGALSNWVVGAFADYDFMNLKGSNTLQNNVGAGVGIPVTGDEKESGAWYVGARIGYLVSPNLLTYWDGGWTQTRFDQVNFSFTNGAPLGSPTFLPATTFHGWFLGGGTEYALNFSWLPIHGLFWRNEYRYASYQAEDIAIVTSSVPPFSEHSRKYVQTITSSLVWRFNGW